MLSLIAFAAVAAVAAPPSAVYTTLPPELRAAAERFDRAQVEGDRELLEQSLAADFSLVSGSGKLQPRAEFIAESTAPGSKVDPFVIREPVEKVWADGAILGGLVDYSGTDGGQRFSITYRFTDVWVRRDGRWQVINAQVTRAPARP
jgi:hypothetical protein